MALSSQKKQQLKAQAHKLNPVVMIGDKGFSENVLAEIDISLTAHELIKVKIDGADKMVRQEITKKICQSSACELVQMIGNISVLYRKNKKK